MNPREFYEQLVSEIEEADIKRVAQIMLKHIGESNLISLEDLALQAFGKLGKDGDRKTRLILAKLVNEHHMPIGAYSGKAGRWLCADDEELNRVIMDLTARHNETGNRIHSLRLSKVPPKEPKFEKAIQNSLWS
jgi:hypothetical protein